MKYLFILLSLLLIACGSDTGGTPPNENPPTEQPEQPGSPDEPSDPQNPGQPQEPAEPGEPTVDQLEQTDAAQLALLFRRSTEFLTGVFTNPAALADFPSVEGPTTQGITRSQEGCLAVTGDTTDFDGDERPVNLNVVFNCVEDGFVLRGTVVVQDADDDDFASGYTVTISDYELTFDEGDGQESTFIDLSFTLDSESYEADYTFDMRLTTATSSSAYLFDELYSYTPDSAAFPFASGTLTFGGAVTLVNGKTFQLGASSDGLHFGDNCAFGVDAGSITFEQASDEVLISYAACFDPNVFFNGVPLGS